jgi:hypothetical protein
MNNIKFRPLTESEIEVKVKQVKENGLVALLYKTARTDMDLLDECVGAENWVNDYREIKDNLYCGIGIKNGDEWIWKWDCGIESREDDEGNEKKGEASDAFKRAGFRVGIGRALYSSPFIWIPAEKANIKKNQSGKCTCNDKFKVERIVYSENEKRIVGLAIINATKKERCFVWQEQRS